MSRQCKENRLRSENESAVSGMSPRDSNIERWNATGRKHPQIAAKTAEFGALMAAFIGPKPTALQLARATSATALYTATLEVQRRLLTGRGRYVRVADLLSLLPTLASALERTLRSLRAYGTDPGPEDRQNIVEVALRAAERARAEKNETAAKGADGKEANAP